MFELAVLVAALVAIGLVGWLAWPVMTVTFASLLSTQGWTASDLARLLPLAGLGALLLAAYGVSAWLWRHRAGRFGRRRRRPPDGTA